MIGALEEFQVGLELARSDSSPAAIDSPLRRFLVNALYAYATSFFMAKGNNLVTALTRIGHRDVTLPAIEVLDRPLGTITLRAILKPYRDRFLAHPEYSIESIFHMTRSGFDMNAPGNDQIFAARRNEFFYRIADMRSVLQERFPEAYEQSYD